MAPRSIAAGLMALLASFCMPHLALAQAAPGSDKAAQDAAEAGAKGPAVDEDAPATVKEQELPMVKEVTSGRELQQSAQEGYAEAVKGVAGVAPGNAKGSSVDTIYLRGIKLNLSSNYRLNGGLPTILVITAPTEDKERLESLKGANALMFGVAAPGGIINMVTKRAQAEPTLTLAFAGNGFGQSGGIIDVGRRFGSEKQAGLRVNASYTALQNGIRDTNGDGQFASAGLDWSLASSLKVQGDFEYQRKHVRDQAGVNLLPAVNGVAPVARPPDPRNLLVGLWPMQRADTLNAQVRADFLPLENLDFMAEAGLSHAYRTRFTTRIDSYDVNTGAGGVVKVNTVEQKYDNYFARAEAQGKFNSWFLGHALTIGVSGTERDADIPMSMNTTLSTRQNIYDPIELPAPAFTGANNSVPLRTSLELGFYAHDVISVLPTVKALVGVRRTKDTENNHTTPASSFWITTPAFGLLWDVLPQLTAFGSYLEGLESGADAPVNAVNAFQILPPAVSKQKEVGFRLGLTGLTLSSSLFEVRRANPVIDPATRIFANNGELHYRGVEATLKVDVLRWWTLDFGGQWTRVVQESPDQTIDGLVPENSAKLIGNARLTQRLPWVPGLSFYVGASGMTPRYVNQFDQGQIPGYMLYAAGANYKTRIWNYRLALNLNVDNLANLRYWNSINNGTYGTGMDRAFKFGAKIDFL